MQNAGGLRCEMPRNIHGGVKHAHDPDDLVLDAVDDQVRADEIAKVTLRHIRSLTPNLYAFDQAGERGAYI
jgi:hypothetical protein